jgi:hypothetical protein
MATRPALAKKAPAKKAAAKKSTPATPKPEAAVVPVVTLKSVFEQLRQTHDLTKKQALALLADFVAAMTTHLCKVRVQGACPRGGAWPMRCRKNHAMS